MQDLTRREEESRKTSDYKQFLLDELLEANLSPDEQEHLEDQLNVITHSEEIKSSLFQVYRSLGEDQSVIGQVSEAESNLNIVSAYHTEIEQLRERLVSSLIDLKEISRELAHLEEGIDFNPEQLSLYSKGWT